MTEAIKLKQQATAKDIAEEAKKIAAKKNNETKLANEKKEDYSAFISSNQFAKIMFDTTLSPEAKKNELTKVLTYSKESTKEQNREKLKNFEDFKEYLQEQRKILNKEGIKLQDTKAFSELQSVIDDMTSASVEFQDKIKPLLDVLNAVFEIRKHDKITDVYREIQNDKAWNDEQTQKLEGLTNQLLDIKKSILNLQTEKSKLAEDRSLFGLGSIKQKSREKISVIEAVELPQLYKNLETLNIELENQKKLIEQGPNSQTPELRKQKEVLKKFLDLTKEENTERQKSLINAAVNYVDTSDIRLKSVLLTLNRLGKHAEIVSDANGTLRNMHLIMDESLKEVSRQNSHIKTELETPVQDESSISRMTREERLKEANEYITLSDESAIDIANSIGGLTKHSVQIQAYKDTLRNESQSTRRLHLEGVSQMGEQLMSVISAISSAATSESRAVAANNFAKMAEQNQTIISQEVVKNASNIELEANSIAKLVGELEDYGQVLNASNEIASQGYSKMKDTVDAIRKISSSVQDSIQEFVADRASAGIALGTENNDNSEVETTSEIQNPFSKLKS